MRFLWVGILFMATTVAVWEAPHPGLTGPGGPEVAVVATKARPQVYPIAKDGGTPTATPTAIPTPTPDPPLWPEEPERFLAAGGFEAWRIPGALKIIQCESGGNPGALGQAGEIGLFQIMPSPWTTNLADPVCIGADLWDPMENVICARAILAYEEARGYQPWANWTCEP